MKKIFVSGPYTKGDVAINVKKAMDMCNTLINLGYAPFCPHLTHFLHINNPLPYEKWLELDIEYLKICDGLIRMEGKSEGADKEVEFANENNIQVFYSIGDIKKYDF